MRACVRALTPTTRAPFVPTRRWTSPHYSKAAWLAAYLSLALLVSGASAQTFRPHQCSHADVVEGAGSRSMACGAAVSSTLAARSGRMSTTHDDQILVELAPEDTSPANLFDLNGRTLVFTPDRHGGYTRSVRSVTWESGLGQPVADGAEIDLESFTFDFAGREWDSFFVSRRGLITFGQALTFSYSGSGVRFGTMREFAELFVTTPTISALYKPMLGGLEDRYGATQHVAQGPDRVVVTWITSDTPDFYELGVAPASPVSFQLVLSADGSIRFNYADVALGDGVVGLFPDEEVARGDLIASVADPRNAEVPGHLDLLNVAVYGTTSNALILDITTRERHRAGQFYRLHFDADKPYWSHEGDLDFSWGIDVEADGNRFVWSSGPTRPTLLAIDGNRLTLLVHVEDGISASLFAGVGPIDDEWRQSDTSPALPIDVEARRQTDLSRTGGGISVVHSEVFHYRSIRDLDLTVCRVIDALGDKFDLFVFHSEFRVDAQTAATPWQRYGANVDVTGLGSIGGGVAPCGSSRLKGRWVVPVWARSDSLVNKAPGLREGPYDRGLLLFAHEFTHAWTAHGWFYLRRGGPERLFDDVEAAHWRWDLHLPAAFPWRSDEPGPRSLMGGRYWRENGDGTFTLLDGYWGGGHSWLDLYAAGLADASEVPDMFILRNLQPVNDGDRWGGRYTGEKEVVTIEQIIAAHGPRVPSAADAQKDFNAGFVYLLEPGRSPDPDLLRLHAEYRDKVVEHWSHVTGGRSRMTTVVPRGLTRLLDQVLELGEPDATFDLSDSFSHFIDARSYDAESSDTDVVRVAVVGGELLVTPVGAGKATVTVTAIGADGERLKRRFVVEVKPPVEAGRSRWRGWRLELLRRLATKVEDES